MMSENVTREDNGRSTPASIDTTANILQATYKHYFEIAIDHHTKAATTSNFLLIIVGVMISFVSFDTAVGGTVDLVSGAVVFGTGLFGIVWTRKQFERYKFWQHIAHQYQRDLAEMVPELNTENVYRPMAKASTEKDFKVLTRIHELWLWGSLHGIVAAIGLGLMVLAALS